MLILQKPITRAELHADLERLLLEHGSEGEYLWGFNLYPEEDGRGS